MILPIRMERSGVEWSGVEWSGVEYGAGAGEGGGGGGLHTRYILGNSGWVGGWVFMNVTHT
jgi:hypothetical protein